MLAPTAPGIAMASCRQWSTPGTSLLSAVFRPPLAAPGRWRVSRASLPRSAEVLRAVAELRTDPRFRAVTVGHPAATVRRQVAPRVRHGERGSYGLFHAAPDPFESRVIRLLAGVAPRPRR